MRRDIRIHVNDNHAQLVVTEDNQVMEYRLADRENRSVAGLIYKGKVTRVVLGIQAAFVDIGLEKNAFLPLSFREATLRQGEDVIVQLRKDPVQDKGPKASRSIHLVGEYVVYMPDGDQVGVSHKIRLADERQRLKEIGQIWAKDGEGFIFRTGSSGCAEKLLADEIEKLRRQYYRLLKRAQTAEAPSLLSEPLDIVQQLANPYLQREYHSCLVNDEHTYQQLKDQVQEPEKRNRIHLHQEGVPMIDTDLRNELSRAMQRKVWLKSGAYLLIDELETLTVIDVNTGRFTGKNDVQETLWQTNREAAREAARQIRLRNIGGIILIDFIDMLDEENAKDVVRVLEEAFTEDMNQTNIKGLTALGLMELTRHKMRLSLREMTSEICSTCGGRGRLTVRHPWEL